MSSWDNRWINEWPEGVGRAATEAVVYSSITILTSSFFLTLIPGQIFHTI